MSTPQFMDKIRSFFGLRPEPPKNDFRNPIWGSDDDDDGDELYTRQQMETYDPLEMHREFVKHIQDMFKNIGSVFDDMKSFIGQSDMDVGTITDFPAMQQEPDKFDSNRIRDYYLKPGYHEQKFEHLREDIDLDGQITSNDLSGLLQQKDLVPQTPFNGKLIPGKSFCKTIITTSVTKPDGTVETRRIIKNGDEVIEETTTTAEPGTRNLCNPSLNPIETTHIMLSQLSSLLRNFY